MAYGSKTYIMKIFYHKWYFFNNNELAILISEFDKDFEIIRNIKVKKLILQQGV